jgi:hypothetical protein
MPIACLHVVPPSREPIRLDASTAAEESERQLLSTILVVARMEEDGA